MSYKIFSSSSFEKSLKGLKKKHPTLKSDLANLIAKLKDNPFIGTSIGRIAIK